MIVTLQPKNQISKKNRLLDRLQIGISVVHSLILDFKVAFVVTVRRYFHLFSLLFWSYFDNRLDFRLDLGRVCEGKEDFFCYHLAQVDVVAFVILL